MGDNPGGHVVRINEASGGHVRMGDASGGRDMNMRDRDWDSERERLMMSDNKEGHG